MPIRYITNGAATGGVTLDRFGRGERHDGDGDPTSNSNCDPFLLDANYVEPTFNTVAVLRNVHPISRISTA